MNFYGFLISKFYLDNNDGYVLIPKNIRFTNRQLYRPYVGNVLNQIFSVKFLMYLCVPIKTI